MFYSIEAEKSVIGSILYFPELYNTIVSVTVPEDFYDPLTRKAYKAIESVNNKGLDINYVTVSNELLLQKVVDVDETYLREVMTSYRVDEEAAQSFATQISEFAGLRAAKIGLASVLTQIDSNTEDSERTLTNVISAIQKLTDSLSRKSYKSSELYGTALVEDFMSMLMSSSSESIKFTGISVLDAHLVDVNPGELIIIAARPAVGKTALMLQAARVMMRSGKRVGFISREMRPNKLMQRLTSAYSGIDMSSINSANLDNLVENPRMQEALKFYSEEGRFVVDTAEPGDIDTIERSMRKMVSIHKVDIIFLDYLQLVEGSTKKRSEGRQQEISHISRRLKITADVLSIPIVAASQLSRETTKTVSQRPMLSHLRESGAIEQDASLVIFIYPLFSENMSEDQKELQLKERDELMVMIEIGKQRNGPLTSTQVLFKKSIGLFVEAASMRDTTGEYGGGALPC